MTEAQGWTVIVLAFILAAAALAVWDQRPPRAAS